MDCNLDCDRDRDPDEAPVYAGHSLFIMTKSVTVVIIDQLLFDGPEIAIHPISGLKYLNRDSESSVYTGQNSQS